jgi:hypothetical protein
MVRISTSLLLALVLVLTSQSMAVARGGSAATGQMVICTGSGPMAVLVDADGQPVEAAHLCPDATLQVLTDVDAPLPAFLRAGRVLVPEAMRACAPCTRALRQTPPSRAPPPVA